MYIYTADEFRIHDPNVRAVKASNAPRHTNTPVIKLLTNVSCVNLLQPTGYVMHQQFNIQQLYVLPTLYLCVLYLSENKQRLVPLTA